MARDLLLLLTIIIISTPRTLQIKVKIQCQQNPDFVYYSTDFLLNATLKSDCAAGQYLVGITCTECPAGNYQPDSYQTTCDICKGGKYQSETGALSCDDECLAGTYSEAGASSCTECKVGRYSGATATSCAACAVGYATNKTGQAACDSCSKGTYAAASASIKCFDCDAGSYTNSTASSSCEKCAYADGEWSVSGSSACDICLDGYFKHPHRDECVQCDSGPFKGVVCPHLATTIESVTLEKGYWRTSAESTKIYACVDKLVCRGGNDTSAICADGHRGVLCSVCEDGYYAAGAACEDCETSGWLFPVIVCSVFAVIIILAILLYKCSKKRSVRSRLSRILRSRGKQIFVFVQVVVTMSTVYGFTDIWPDIYLNFLSYLSFFVLEFP